METTTDTQQGTVRFLRLLHKREATTGNRNPKYTTWVEATANPFTAISELLRCLDAGYNAWIERQENGDQFYPIRMKNPKLDKAESWKIDKEKVTTEEEILSDTYFFNETTRRLTLESDKADGSNKHLFYKPKGGIPNYITKPLTRKVYVICFNLQYPTPPLWVKALVWIEQQVKHQRMRKELKRQLKQL